MPKRILTPEQKERKTEYNKNYREKPEVKARQSEYYKKRRAENPPTLEQRAVIAKKARESYAKNPPTDEQKERSSKYMKKYNSSAENKAKRAACSKKYRTNNRGVLNAINARYRTEKMLRTPVWADLNAIKDVYLEAEYQQMEVDHIIPLQGKLVSGLHVWDNLQLLTPTANRSKGNRFLGGKLI